jgi:hypothetical protein
MTDLAHPQMKVLDMGLQCPFSESPSTNRMAACRLSIVYGSLVLSNVIVFSGLLVVVRRMYKMFRNFSVVFGSPLRHEISPRLNDCSSEPLSANSTLEVTGLFPYK